MNEQNGKDMEEIRIVLPEISSIEEVTAFFEEQLTAAGAPAKTIAQVNVAVDEIFSNIARYSRAKKVTVSCLIEGKSAILRFEDDGVPYDPTKTSEPDITLSAEDREIGGLGLFMVKKIMDRVEYACLGGCNVLTLEKGW